MTNLLSLPGPSLFQAASMVSSGPISEFNTNTLLDSYRADPATGSLIGPGLQRAEGTTSQITIGPLVEETAAGFRNFLNAVVSGARKLESEKGYRSPRFVSVPEPQDHLSRTTDRRWSYVFDHERNLFLKGASGQVVKIEPFSDSERSIVTAGIGWSREHSEAVQSVTILEKNDGVRIKTDFYHFYFQAQALAGLKTLLGLNPDGATEDAALEIMARIYTSGQYASEELSEDAAISFLSGQSYLRTPLSFEKSGKIGLAEGLALDGRDFQIESLHWVDHVDWPLIHMRGDRESLTIRLYQHPKDYGNLLSASLLIPLRPSLRELLWETA